LDHNVHVLGFGEPLNQARFDFCAVALDALDLVFADAHVVGTDDVGDGQCGHDVAPISPGGVCRISVLLIAAAPIQKCGCVSCSSGGSTWHSASSVWGPSMTSRSSARLRQIPTVTARVSASARQLKGSCAWHSSIPLIHNVTYSTIVNMAFPR